ncbi:TlpA disulfide reductase family protein [uncultured Sphingomonas sp.]|uniref:TlpA family protein disulfide reductase n=1 Tax=uncultured Sphingomonas sp. TaxID=158754 RepID=UPI0025F3AE21|nr:TlpA disulfide reductase family protein [uncultured Sphingomonas sp.]
MIKHWLIAALAALFWAAPASARLPKIGEVAPDFTFTLMDGSKVSRDDLKGQVVLLNFWATWCVPCRAELPLIDRYYDLQKKHGFRAFAVTTGDSLPLYRMKPLFAAMAIPAVKRSKGPYSEVSAVPMNYIIDRAGRIRYATAGAFDLDTLNKVIVPLLQEPAPAG